MIKKKFVPNHRLKRAPDKPLNKFSAIIDVQIYTGKINIGHWEVSLQKRLVQLMWRGGLDILG